MSTSGQTATTNDISGDNNFASPDESLPGAAEPNSQVSKKKSEYKTPHFWEWQSRPGSVTLHTIWHPWDADMMARLTELAKSSNLPNFAPIQLKMQTHTSAPICTFFVDVRSMNLTNFETGEIRKIRCVASNLSPIKVPQRHFMAVYRMQFMGYPQTTALDAVVQHPPGTPDYILITYMQKKIDEENNALLSKAMDESKRQHEL